jgi:membrane protein required for colicin V production
MNFIDFIILIPLLWGAIRGFSKGLIIEIASLVALIIGIFVGIHFSYFITSLIGIKSAYAPLIGFVVTFVLVVLVVFIFAKILEKSINLLALGIVNKLAGAFFSAVKFAFILSVLIMFIERMDSSGKIISQETRKSSLLYEPVGHIAPAVFPLIKFDELKKTTDSTKDSKTALSQDSLK